LRRARPAESREERAQPVASRLGRDAAQLRLQNRVDRRRLREDEVTRARGEHLADERRAATREVVDEAGRRDRAGRRFAQGLDAGLEREDERERARERALDGLVEERLGEPDVVE